LNRSKGKNVDGIARDALHRMLEYPWPGNVRELRNAIEHAFVTVTGDRIGYLDLPAEIREGPESRRATDPKAREVAIAADDSERQQIIDALKAVGGNRVEAAKRLGYSRVTLWKKMNRYGIRIASRK
ncbi:MAG: hypothetical protein JJ992_07715, partial [Planctomycetes bacterium]|nr:hypothetical protein [Planctomycetota bacterium]